MTGKLTHEDVAAVVCRLPTSVRLILQAYPVVVAGGAVRDTVIGARPKDVDVFCHSREQARDLAWSCYMGAIPKQSTNAYTVTVDGVLVQFVFYRDFTDAADLISQFDYRACAAAVFHGLDGWDSALVPGFYEDCAARVLTFTRQAKDAGSLVPLKRALRLVAKGWRLPDAGVEHILLHWEPDLVGKPIRRALSAQPSYGGRQ